MANNNNNKLPLISIITVVYNGEKYIEQTILSVLNQSYSNVEYIIIDGGSNDGTIDIIKKYEHKIVYWISEPDKGVYDAMNKGIEKATGDWVYFLGVGDFLLNVLDKLTVKFIDANCIYYGNVYRLDLLKIYDGYFSPFKLAVNNICHQAIFYPSSVFKKHKYELEYKTMADHILNMHCYGDKEFIFQYYPIIIAIYEGNGYSTHNIDVSYIQHKLDIVKKNFSLPVYMYVVLRRKLRNFINCIFFLYGVG